MHLSVEDIPPQDRYRILVNTILPRPIAWLSTRDAQGHVNLAPFSFFNALCSPPPIVGIGIGADNIRSNQSEKDSLRAIRETGEFVVALVDEANAEAMNLSAIDAPRGVDEFDYAGVEAGEAKLVKAPIVVNSPVNFECKLWQLLEPGPNAAIVLGEVVAVRIDDRLLSEEDGKMRIDGHGMHLIGRGHGTGWYWRGSDQIEINRKSWAREHPGE